MSESIDVETFKIDDLTFECQLCHEILDTLKYFKNPVNGEKLAYCGKNGCYSSWFRIMKKK